MVPPILAAKDHRAETLGHGQGHHNVKYEKQKNRAHRQKMHDPGAVEIPEEICENLELHRLPNRQSGQDRDDASSNHSAIKKANHYA